MTRPAAHIKTIPVSAAMFKYRQPALQAIATTAVLLLLGDSYAATALFYLGLNMVGKLQRMKAKTFVTPVLLICAKM